MANHIVKTIKNPDDPLGRRISSIDGVMRYLRSGEKQLGEIKKFLKNNDCEYTKPGLLGLLEKLMNKKYIKKHLPKNGKYQTYYLSKKIKDDVPLLAKMFAIEASTSLLNTTQSFEPKDKIYNLIQKIGFYTLFNYLHSWNFRTENSNKSQVEWLESVLPMKRVSFYLLGENIWELNDQKKVRELKKTLEKLYPDEYEKCEKIISDLIPSTENFFKQKLNKNSIRIISEDI